MKINYKKTFLSALLILISINFSQSGEIATDITAFQNDPYTGLTQVMCYYSFDSAGELFYFSSATFDTKLKGIDFYKTIVPNWATLDRSNLAYSNTILSDNGTITNYVSAQALCVLRTNKVDITYTSVPPYSYLSTVTGYKYFYFPTINGYPRKGGAAVYKHVKHLSIPYTSNAASLTAEMLVFQTKFNNYFSPLLSNYNSENNTTLKSLWGSHFRYSPVSEIILTNNYYVYPRIKKGTAQFNTTNPFSTANLGTNAALVTSFLQNSYPTLTSTPTTCVFDTNKIYVLRSSTNCSITNSIMTCTTDPTNVSANNTFLIGKTITFSKICSDPNTTIWLELNVN